VHGGQADFEADKRNAQFPLERATRRSSSKPPAKTYGKTVGLAHWYKPDGIKVVTKWGREGKSVVTIWEDDLGNLRLPNAKDGHVSNFLLYCERGRLGLYLSERASVK
jgi:hypothetical protein